MDELAPSDHLAGETTLSPDLPNSAPTALDDEVAMARRLLGLPEFEEELAPLASRPAREDQSPIVNASPLVSPEETEFTALTASPSSNGNGSHSDRLDQAASETVPSTLDDEVAQARRLLGLPEYEQDEAALEARPPTIDSIAAAQSEPNSPSSLEESASIPAPDATAAELPILEVAASGSAQSESWDFADIAAAAVIGSAVSEISNISDNDTLPLAFSESAQVETPSSPQESESIPSQVFNGEVEPAFPKELEPGELPEWMRELTPPDADAPQAETFILASQVPELDEAEKKELPDWLRDSIPVAGAISVDAASDEFDQDEGAFDEAAVLAAVAEPEPEPQTTAALANAVAPVVESTGPLAGVSGVLPLAIAAAEPHKLVSPPLPRTDGGKVFEAVLALPVIVQPPAPKTADQPRLITANHLIYLLVLLAALLALFLPSDISGLGLEFTTSPTAIFYDHVQAAPPGSSVLLSFDYTPGQAAELDPAARVVVQDLAQRKLNVVAFSLTPGGAGIAQDVLSEAVQQNPGFAFVNLGYIPGSEAGLRQLATLWIPRDFPDANGIPWSASPLSSRVKGLDDFALVIPMTGGDEPLRWWMEQVQPLHKGAISAVITAAIEPSARNYTQSLQLAGFMRGLTGAAEYELLLNHPSQAVRTVDALSFVSLAVAAVIILGNVAFLMNRPRKKQPA